jgi:hypothetical protein
MTTLGGQTRQSDHQLCSIMTARYEAIPHPPPTTPVRGALTRLARVDRIVGRSKRRLAVVPSSLTRHRRIRELAACNDDR